MTINDAETREKERWDRRDALLLVLLAGLVVLFFWRIVTPNLQDRAQFPPGDFTDQFYAFRLYEARAFAQGRLPLWSENFNSGHPFLADVQSAVYYPIGLGNTLLNSAVLGGGFSLFALELEALLHFFLAGAFTYLFARRVMRSRIGAFTAALVFTFGGYLTSYPSLQLAILETATWLPLALFFADRAAERRRTVDVVAAGIVLGVAALAGHPQTFLFVAAVCLIYFVFRAVEQERANAAPAHSSNRRAILSALWSFAPILLIALGLSAAQWVPSLEYQRLSVREALAFRDAAAGFPTLDIVQFVFPGFVSAFASPLYVGILPLWLAIFALLTRTRERMFWLLLALASLLLAFGFYVFAYVVFYLFVPGAPLFREQERLALVVSFALAMLAGYGMRDLLEIFARHRVSVARRLFLLLPAGAVLSFTLLVTFVAVGATGATGKSPLQFAFLGDRAGLMTVLFVLASAVVGAYVRGWISPRVFTVLALALIVFDLFSVNEPANKGAVAERFDDNALVDTVKQDAGIFRVADEKRMPGHFGIPYDLEEIGGVSPLRLAAYDDLLQLAPKKLWRLLGVKYVFTSRTGFANAEVVGQDGETRLLRLNNTLPRAWLVGAAQVESDDGRAVATLSGADFDPSVSAVLASPAPFALDARASGGSVDITSRAPERLTLDVNAPADGLLVVGENFYPGWNASVDGAPVDIVRTDVSLRGVPVRAGQHRVEMVYDPLSVKIGMLISIATLVVCAGLLVVGGRKTADHGRRT